MKTVILLGILLAVNAGIGFAQENKTIKEETTVKRVVKKEGSTVIVQEVEATKSEKGAVIVADDEQENQVFSERTKMEDKEKVLVDETEIDAQNEAMILANKQQKEKELQESIEAAKAKAEAQRKMLAEKEAARLKAVEENRKRLEKRGKGVRKLKKKKGN
jgi:DNA-binding helix-hairpin-helix protein with protein kinase domain